MLIDQLLKSLSENGLDGEQIMRRVLPYIFHFTATPGKISEQPISKLMPYISGVDYGPVYGVDVDIPTTALGLFPMTVALPIIDRLSVAGASVDYIWISYSEDHMCMEALRPNNIQLAPMLYHILPAINPNDASSKEYYTIAYDLATMPFDIDIRDSFYAIYKKLGRLSAIVGPDNFYLLHIMYLATMREYCGYKDMVLDALPSVHALSFSCVREALVQTFLSTLSQLEYCVNCNDTNAVTDVMIKALARERLIVTLISGADDIPHGLRRIPEVIATKLGLISKLPSMQELIARSAIYSKNLIDGKEEDMDIIKASDDIPKTLCMGKRARCGISSCVTPDYICGHLAGYVDDLSPEDISFDLPEERLAMLVHDLGSQNIYLVNENGKFVHYYEEGSELYKLFMTKDSARIVYGMNNNPSHIEIIRFSDANPKYDYVFSY